MEQGSLKIYVEQLHGGREQLFSESLDPEKLQLTGGEASFRATVRVEGRAYLAEEELVVCYDTATRVELPCAICNAPVELSFNLKALYECVPLEEVRGGIYYLDSAVRTALLLELPHYVECGGNCPERKSLAPYMKREREEEEDEGYHPFAELDDLS